eukprot:CAMPEP_0170638732 /NCGR_PEP_ID=MMETSP0224-20130122/39236_1 /TAXON_ID=285029 /ORGANISM="Togula jolla, Strain CCCM 725" /LENGTH=98 /DNA_ID=CAMNT_0010968967 /DNA_START=404 /DNA_END=697 /DNA_ORIENTATION=+
MARASESIAHPCGVWRSVVGEAEVRVRDVEEPSPPPRSYPVSLGAQGEDAAISGENMRAFNGARELPLPLAEAPVAPERNLTRSAAARRRAERRATSR